MQSSGHDILLFINSGSGGGIGKSMVQSKIQRIDFNIQNQTQKVYFYNMRSNRQQGFQHLKRISDQGQPTIAVICGGDGTVMWVISEMDKYKVNPNLVRLAIMPLGTGNDFSRALGWGKQQNDISSDCFTGLRDLVQKWITAVWQPLDLWQLQVSTYSSGGFFKVQNSEQKSMEEKFLKRHFVNYFSLGVDAEVGFEFDKNRTTTRAGNLAMYGLMGIIKGIQTSKTLGELIQNMSADQCIFQGNNKGFLDYIGSPFTFNFSDLIQGVKKVNSFHNNQNLLALNINSYMGGVTDIWRKAKVNQTIKQKDPHTQASHSDGKIQFVSFSDAGKLGLEKTLGKLDISFAQRIAQGHGPFSIKFRQYQDNPDHCTFLQIDGEFIKASHPKQLLLKASSLFQGRKVYVLHNK